MEETLPTTCNRLPRRWRGSWTDDSGGCLEATSLSNQEPTGLQQPNAPLQDAESDCYGFSATNKGLGTEKYCFKFFRMRTTLQMWFSTNILTQQGVWWRAEVYSRSRHVRGRGMKTRRLVHLKMDQFTSKVEKPSLQWNEQACTSTAPCRLTTCSLGSYFIINDFIFLGHLIIACLWLLLIITFNKFKHNLMILSSRLSLHSNYNNLKLFFYKLWNVS